MKKIIALVAVAAMLFALVPVANAAVYNWPMQMKITKANVIYGPDITPTTGDFGPGEMTITPDGATSASSNIAIIVSQAYGDFDLWYNYTNSLTQEAWYRLPIVVANTTTDGKSSLLGDESVVFYPANPVFINNVAYYASLDAGNYIVWYPIRAIAGGNTEILTVEYSPNGVESYVGTINFTYIDTSANSSAFVLTDTGSNAAYFNSKWSGGNMVFDTVMKSTGDNMARTNVEYKHKTIDISTLKLTDGDADIETIEVPTIKMSAKVTVRDINGNPLPIRSIVAGSLPGNEAPPTATTIYGLESLIFDDDATTPAAPGTPVVNYEGSLFSAAWVYADLFGYTTVTDDQYYGELNSDGSFEVKINVIDNSLAVIDDKVAGFIDAVLDEEDQIIRPYFTTLDDILIDSDTVRVIGAQNQVNYAYVKDINQTIYAANNSLNAQGKEYDIVLHAMDRLETPTVSIIGAPTSKMAPGTTAQLTSVSTHSNPTDSVAIWKSSDPTVATVNSAGLLTAIRDGVTYVTAHYEADNAWATVAISVGTEAPVITAPPSETTTTYYVAARNLNVRTGPGTSYSRVGKVSRPATLEVYSIDNGWAKVDYNGSIAYVSANYLSK